MSVLIESGADKEVKCWYALRTMPRAEKKVNTRLLDHNHTTFLPLIPTIKQWSDRKKKVDIPLIPGFVFVRCTREELLDCMRTQGVAGIIRYLGKPAKVKEFEIAQLKILIKAPESIALINFESILPGEEVTVIYGPFAGLKGKCIRTQGQYKVIVELKTLCSKVEVNIPIKFLDIYHLKVA